MINWSGISNRGFLGKLLRLPLKIIPGFMVMKIRRGPYRGMKWIAGSSTHGCWLGTYELNKQTVLKKFIKPGMVIYDVGAQAGIYTLLFSKLVGQKGEVFAFEPFAENVANLLRHIHLNQLCNVTVFQVALADESGLSSFAIGKGNCTGSLTQTHTQLQVPTFSLDELVTEFDFPIPDLVKIDVEGSEAVVFKGMKKVFALKKTIIFVALHGDEQKRLCQDILLENGYELFWLSGNSVEGRLEDYQGDEVYALPI